MVVTALLAAIVTLPTNVHPVPTARVASSASTVEMLMTEKSNDALFCMLVNAASINVPVGSVRVQAAAPA